MSPKTNKMIADQDQVKHTEEQTFTPLATRLRPRNLDEFFGQEHLVGQGKPLRHAYDNKVLHSMILWGPPGTGKTTLARILANNIDANMEFLTAVTAGVKDIREVTARADEMRRLHNKPTLLFVDEVHRFNKAQQDAFLPLVEEGKIILIGATTENPSFELNNALLSRARVYVLKSLTNEDLQKIVGVALQDQERGLGERHIVLPDEIRQTLLNAAQGDARTLLNFLEIAADLAEENSEGPAIISEKVLAQVLTDGVRRFDKHGDLFYEQISALHKAVRGSDPDASLYWFARMIDGGCNPEYIARRVVRMASEDIGNAEPQALPLALAAWQTYERLGSPEGELAIAQIIIYLAIAPKSNASYLALGKAKQDVKEYGSLDVPKHICNAPTKLMQNLGYGKDYRYAHDEANAYAYVAGEKYFPDEMPKRIYYEPTERGLEARIKQKLAELRKLDANNR